MRMKTVENCAVSPSSTKNNCFSSLWVAKKRWYRSLNFSYTSILPPPCSSIHLNKPTMHLLKITGGCLKEGKCADVIPRGGGFHTRWFEVREWTFLYDTVLVRGKSQSREDQTSQQLSDEQMTEETASGGRSPSLCRRGEGGALLVCWDRDTHPFAIELREGEKDGGIILMA